MTSRFRPTLSLAAALLWLLMLPANAATDAAPGAIEGWVTDAAGRPIVGLKVELPELQLVTESDAEGGYRFAPLPPGTYDLLFDPSGEALLEKGIVVVPGQTANLDVDLARTSWLPTPSMSHDSFDQLGAEELFRWGHDGQLGRSAAAIGLPLAQPSFTEQFVGPIGLRRAGTGRQSLRLDGRDLVDPFTGRADWSLVNQPVENLATLDASAAEVEIRSRQPRYSEGGFVRLGAGERGATQSAVSWRGYVIANWWVSVVASGRSEGGRVDAQSADGSLRIDKVWSNGARLELEQGWSRLRDALEWTPVGAVQTLESTRPWSRGRYLNDRWEVEFVHDRRDSSDQRLQQTGGLLSALSQRRRVAIARRGRSLEGRLRWSLGGDYRDEQIRRTRRLGSDSWIARPIRSDRTRLSAALDWRPDTRWTVAGQLAWNGANRTSSRWTPALRVGWNVAPHHQLSLGYEESFRAATIAEQSLRIADGGQVDLTALESICTAEMVDCGFGGGLTESFIVGNRALDLETMRRWSLVWRSRPIERLDLQLQFAQTEHDDVVGDAVAQCGGPLGDCLTPAARANLRFQPYLAPAGLSAMARADLLSALQGALGSQFFSLSNDLDGAPLWVGSTFAELGDLTSRSAELRADYRLAPDWSLRASAGWFDADLNGVATAAEDLLRPNQPKFRGSAALRRIAARWDGQLAARWSDGYRAGAAFLVADVDPFLTVDAQLNWSAAERWTLTLHALDLADEEQVEWAGGEWLGRRLMLSGRFAW